MIITEDNCFFPDRYDYYHPTAAGYDTEEIWIADRIFSWLIRPKKPSVDPATIVHLHGNAENMSTHILGALFLLEAGYNLLTFDYAGYGRSTGSPSLEGIQKDALKVFSRIFSEPEKFGNAVFGFGQSMGGLTLGLILPRIPSLKGAIFDCALYSFHELFRQAYPMHECTVPKISSLDTLPLSNVPKLFIHGTADEVVPYFHSEKMFEISAGPKELYLAEGAGHISAIASQHAEEYKDRIISFIGSNHT